MNLDFLRSSVSSEDLPMNWRPRSVEALRLSYYGTNAPPPAPDPMTKEEEHALFLRYHKRKTAKVREQLLRHYLCWAFSMAARFKGPRLCFDEAVSVANEGLVEALNGYNPTLGFRFSTYAAWVLRRKLITAIVSTYPVKISDHVRKQWRHIELDPAVLAARMAADEPTTLEEFFERLGEGCEFNLAELHERPADSPFMPAPAESPADHADSESLSAELKEALKKLDPLEREVVTARHYREPAESFLELGRRLHVSKSRAREAYDSAIIRLRRHFKKDKL